MVLKTLKINDFIQYKKPLIDMTINIVANAVPILVIQMAIFPLLSLHMGEEDYGLFLTLVAMLNTVPAGFGNVLNNIRLKFKKKYIDSNLGTDFPLLLVLFQLLSFLLVVSSTVYFTKSTEFLLYILLTFTSVTWLAREYYIVAFRLTINYRAIFIANILTVVGYIVGYLIFLQTEAWYWIYILGNVFSLIYILLNCRLLSEALQKTNLFKYILGQSLLLLAAGFVGKLLMYADKFMLYPLLGGALVSVYYVSTLSGKIITLIIGPVSGVMLTYLSKMKKNDKMFEQILTVSALLCLLGYIFGVVVSEPVLRLLYPGFAERALKYIYITTAAAVISAFYSIINPFIMNFFEMKWQLVISAGTVVAYVLISLLFLKQWGLLGFCYGVLITNIIRVISGVVIYYRADKVT